MFMFYHMQSLLEVNPSQVRVYLGSCLPGVTPGVTFMQSYFVTHILGQSSYLGSRLCKVILYSHPGLKVTFWGYLHDGRLKIVQGCQ